MPRFVRWFAFRGALALTLVVPAVRAQQAVPAVPAIVEIPQAEQNVLQHHLPPVGAIHLSEQELADLDRRQRLMMGLNGVVQVDLVVSANGVVNSATVVGDAAGHEDDARRLVMSRRYRPWMKDGAPVTARIKDIVEILPPERWGPHVSFPDGWDPSTAVISLRRTACYGSCPDYTVTVAGDGTIRYHGERFVKLPGDHTAHIPPSSAQSLIASFRSANFLSALDTYQESVTDIPTYSLSLISGTLVKRVVDYGGEQVGLPDVIRDLEDSVDEVAGTERWVKGNADTLPSLEAEHWPFAADTAANAELYTAAISSHDEPLVQVFLSAHAPVVSPAAETVSPVCEASGAGDAELVRSMLKPVSQRPSEAPQPPKIPHDVKQQCLARAARGGNVAIFDLWLTQGADPRAPPVANKADWTSGRPLLVQAIDSGASAMVKRVLELKPDVNQVFQEQPILSYAVRSMRNDGTTEILSLLLAAGADPNSRDRMGQTPLFFSQPHAAHVLLAAGADVNARDNSGRTPLMQMAILEPMVQLLLAEGADPAVVAQNNETALKDAQLYRGCTQCIALIEQALKKP